MVKEFADLELDELDDKPVEEVEIIEPVKVYKRLSNGEIGELLRVENGDRKFTAESFKSPKSSNEVAMIAEARKEKIAKWIKENKRIPTVNDFYDFLGDDAKQSKKSTLYSALRKAIKKHNIKTEFVLTDSNSGTTLRFNTDTEVAEYFGCAVGVVRNSLSTGTRIKGIYFIEQIIKAD